MAEKGTLVEARERPKGQAKQFGNASPDLNTINVGGHHVIRASVPKKELRAIERENEQEEKARWERNRQRLFGSGRTQAMTTIDEALALQEKGKPEPEERGSGPASVLPEPSGMPPPPPHDPYGGGERAPAPPPESAEDRKVREAQEDLLGKENAERLREEQRKEAKRRRTLIGIVEGVTDQARESGGKASSVLAALPTPGSLWFPLVLLVLFFFILITYGGNTRLQWAWLVLTGNAGFNLGGQGQLTSAQSGDTSRTATTAPAFGQPGALTLAPQPSIPVGQSAPIAASTGSLSASGVPMTGQPF